MKWLWMVALSVLCACAYEPIRLVDAGEGDAAMEGGVGDAASSDAVSLDAHDGQADDDSSVSTDAGEDATRDAALGDAAGDATVDGGSVLRVEPLFASAPRWNDHVLDDNPHDTLTGSRLNRTAPACTTVSPPSHVAACAHVGVLRQLVLADQTECDGLVLTDARGWLDWACVERDGHVVFEAQALRPDVELRDLLDLTQPAQPRWQTNQITVRRGTDIVAQTDAHAFWDNPVIAIGEEAPSGGHSLDVPGAVYVVTATELHARLRVLADHVTLTTREGVTIRGDGSSAAALIEATNRRFLRIERVQIDPSGYAYGLDLEVTFSTVARVLMSRTAPGLGLGVDARIDGVASTIEDVKVEHATADGIEIAGATNLVRRIRSDQAGARGVVLRAESSGYEGVSADRSGTTGVYIAMRASQVHDITASRSGADGLRMEGARYCRLTRVTVTHSAEAGVVVTGTAVDPDDTELNLVRDVMSTNNETSGIVLRGRNQVLSVAISASNHIGVEINGSGHLVQHVTVASNTDAGVSQALAQHAQVVNLLAINNAHGLRVHPSAVGARVHDAAVTNNGIDVLLEGEGSLFSGMLFLTTEDSCEVTPTLSQPGLVEGPPCAIAGATGSISAPHNFVQALIGRVPAGDMTNADFAQLQAPHGSILSSQISDWVGFSVRQRHWGRHAVASFPGAAFAGDCRTSTDACVVWDWRVTGATVLRDVFGSMVSASALNAPVHQLTHTWTASGSTACQMIARAEWDGTTCTSRFLAYAFEDDDGVTAGNENGLCEALEGCVLNRHRGGFPGQGALEAVHFNVPGFGELFLRRYDTAGP